MHTAPRQHAGLGGALLSAAAFGTSGSFATALIGSGWSPAAAVTARLLVAAAVLTIPALIALRGRLGALVRQRRGIAGYGVMAIAVAQLCYFNAVARLSVGVPCCWNTSASCWSSAGYGCGTGTARGG